MRFFALVSVCWCCVSVFRCVCSLRNGNMESRWAQHDQLHRLRFFMLRLQRHWFRCVHGLWPSPETKPLSDGILLECGFLCLIANGMGADCNTNEWSPVGTTSTTCQRNTFLSVSLSVYVFSPFAHERAHTSLQPAIRRAAAALALFPAPARRVPQTTRWVLPFHPPLAHVCSLLLAIACLLLCGLSCACVQLVLSISGILHSTATQHALRVPPAVTRAVQAPPARAQRVTRTSK